MNFAFLEDFSDFKPLYKSCFQAEKFIYSVPTHSIEEQGVWLSERQTKKGTKTMYQKEVE